MAEVYRRYRESLEAAGLLDEELFAQSALAALRAEPATWGAAPVFVYGFDDFTPLELAALEALAGPAATDVVVSLPYEPGREAFKATERIHDELAELADDVPQPGGRLRPLRRRLTQGAARPGARALRARRADGRFAWGGAPAHLPAASAPSWSSAAPRCFGPCARARRRARWRSCSATPLRYASLVEQVFGAYGIPYSIDRSVALAHTGLGRGLLALLRCALLDGSADDLLCLSAHARASA